MVRAIKFELYKLIKEPFLWGTIAITLIVNFVMTAGTKTTLEGFLQKSFITSIIASLYAAFNVGNDFENGRALYSVLSGNSRAVIGISKGVTAIFATEILSLLFPCMEILRHKDDWDFKLKCVVVISYAVLGVFLGVLGMSMACLFRNAGLAIVAVIIFHLCTLFLMNSEISNIALNVFPIGIVKLLVEGTAQLYSGIIFGGWILLLAIGAIIILKHLDL